MPEDCQVGWGGVVGAFGIPLLTVEFVHRVCCQLPAASCHWLKSIRIIALGRSNDHRIDSYDVNDNDDLLMNINKLG